MSVTARHLVGREEELAAIVGRLDAPERLPGVAVLAGQAGIGKTALWLAGIDAATERGFRVLSTRPAEAETGYSFAALADLLGDLAEDVVSELPPIQRRALEAALLLGDPDRAVDERAIGAAALSALKTISDGNPLLVAIDDVQWLDASSLATLRFALPRLGSAPLATLVTVRGNTPEWLRRALPAERLTELGLGGLSIGALHELIRTRLGTPLSRPMLVRIWETSGGNPFFGLELARALHERGGKLDPGEHLPLPATLEELVHQRIDALADDALVVARVVAFAANPTVELVDSVVGGASETGLTGALDSNVLVLEDRRLRFAHPLLASAVAAAAPRSARRSLHARLARAVATAEERARHLAAATDHPSRATAAALEDAAEAAHLRGAPAAAAELAERAVALTPAVDVDGRLRRLLLAADRYLDAGDFRRAEALLAPALAAASPGPARGTILFHLAQVRKAVAAPPDVIALLHEALDEAPGDDALEASIHLELGGHYGVTVSKDRGLAHAKIAVRLTSNLTDPALRCRALACYVFLHAGSGRGIPEGALEEAVAIERSLPEWTLAHVASNTLVIVLMWLGQIDRARTVAHELRDAFRSRDDPEETLQLWHLTMLEWRAGNWGLAQTYAAEAAAVRDQAGLEGALPILQLPGALVEAHLGNLDKARSTSEQALARAEATGIRISESGHLGVLGFIELSLGNAAAALTYLRPAWEIRDEVRLLEPGHRLELADTLEALIAVGELDEAETLIVEWERRSWALDRAWALAILARCRGLLLAGRGDLDEAFESFERSLAEHARTTDPFQHARTLLALGRTQRRAKRRSAARSTLEDALARFETLGAPLWADQTRAELARIGGRAPSRGELTEAEQRIAALVAKGRSNREVAAALFLTEHSVETALTRVYRKLDVRSRAELAHLLAAKT